MAGQTLEHTGAAIVEEYYPEYASDAAPIYPLYATEIYAGSAIMLLSMSMLGLPITALGYYMDDMGVSLGLVVAAVVATTVVFVLGLAVCMVGFRKYGREDAH
ncbi:hypothetical protein [Dietzia sp. PP-33]|uniref:hypothetical protein n=1 Tax=Dietzia sp. PP-33 TaxID=2957500 RepID=UPI0029B711FE|nr:hypothetical protein [Dietzia sp. PP-33]MDX2356102.1 hypothetical protein [Dietzia sp. PP-33]